MKKMILLVLITSSLIYSQNYLLENNSWKKFYDEDSVAGTFVLSKLGSDSLYVHNPARAKKQYLPASTFKILNSLISLETKVISDENKIIKWDEKKRFYDKWNQDQNLKSAMKYSCVWFYQELARRVGEEKMQAYLDSTKYGNSKIGADIDKFWLEGELRISAFEQIEFLNKFLTNDLPFSDLNFKIVKNIILIDSTDSYQLYAKTGWTARVDNQIGWYVGFVENETETWVFAMNIDIDDSRDAKLREEITRRILRHEKLIK
jgi:beta-lactamase class D